MNGRRLRGFGGSWPNRVTSLDAGMSTRFHVLCQRRGTTEFLRHIIPRLRPERGC
jgi:hypothetical protein